MGFFIITIDFVGYLGTLAILLYKELGAPHIDWGTFYDKMSIYIGIACCMAFIGSTAYIINAMRRRGKPTTGDIDNNNIIITPTAS